ncbi:MAG: hypothetical protein WD426_06210 [Anditalea sp.]
MKEGKAKKTAGNLFYQKFSKSENNLFALDEDRPAGHHYYRSSALLTISQVKQLPVFFFTIRIELFFLTWALPQAVWYGNPCLVGRLQAPKR